MKIPFISADAAFQSGDLEKNVLLLNAAMCLAPDNDLVKLIFLARAKSFKVVKSVSAFLQHTKTL